MKRIIFLSAIAFSLVSCGNKFDKSKIEKLDNEFANNNILTCTVLRYQYNNGVLDSTNIDTVSVDEYGLRGNLKYSKNKAQNEYIKNSFEGTDVKETEIYRISDDSLVYKVKYSDKGNTTTDQYYDAKGKPAKKIVHHKDAMGRDTLYEIYKDDKLINKYTNTFDSIGAKTFTFDDYENAKYNYTRNRVNDDKYSPVYVQKDANDSIRLEDKLAYDKSGKKTRFTRTVFGNNENVYVDYKYTYLTEDGLIEKIETFDESGAPVYVDIYKYLKY